MSVVIREDNNNYLLSCNERSPIASRRACVAALRGAWARRVSRRKTESHISFYLGRAQKTPPRPPRTTLDS